MNVVLINHNQSEYWNSLCNSKSLLLLPLSTSSTILSQFIEVTEFDNLIITCTSSAFSSLSEYVNSKYKSTSIQVLPIESSTTSEISHDQTWTKFLDDTEFLDDTVIINTASAVPISDVTSYFKSNKELRINGYLASQFSYHSNPSLLYDESRVHGAYPIYYIYHESLKSSLGKALLYCTDTLHSTLKRVMTPNSKLIRDPLVVFTDYISTNYLSYIQHDYLLLCSSISSKGSSINVLPFSKYNDSVSIYQIDNDLIQFYSNNFQLPSSSLYNLIKRRYNIQELKIYTDFAKYSVNNDEYLDISTPELSPILQLHAESVYVEDYQYQDCIHGRQLLESMYKNILNTSLSSTLSPYYSILYSILVNNREMYQNLLDSIKVYTLVHGNLSPYSECIQYGVNSECISQFIDVSKVGIFTPYWDLASYVLHYDADEFLIQGLISIYNYQYPSYQIDLLTLMKWIRFRLIYNILCYKLSKSDLMNAINLLIRLEMDSLPKSSRLYSQLLEFSKRN